MTADVKSPEESERHGFGMISPNGNEQVMWDSSHLSSLPFALINIPNSDTSDADVNSSPAGWCWKWSDGPDFR